MFHLKFANRFVLLRCLLIDSRSIGLTSVTFVLYQHHQRGLEIEPTGEAEEREAQEQLTTDNERVGNKEEAAGESKDREGWRDFLMDLSPQWGERVLVSKSPYFFTLC